MTDTGIITTGIFAALALICFIVSTRNMSDGWRLAGFVFVALTVASTGILGGGDCHTDWDGRSNPTVCE